MTYRLRLRAHYGRNWRDLPGDHQLKEAAFERLARLMAVESPGTRGRVDQFLGKTYAGVAAEFVVH